MEHLFGIASSSQGRGRPSVRRSLTEFRWEGDELTDTHSVGG